MLDVLGGHHMILKLTVKCRVLFTYVSIYIGDAKYFVYDVVAVRVVSLSAPKRLYNARESYNILLYYPLQHGDLYAFCIHYKLPIIICTYTFLTVRRPSSSNTQPPTRVTFSAYAINCAIFLLYTRAKYLPDIRMTRVGVRHIINIIYKLMCILYRILLLYLLVCRVESATYIISQDQ